jgi:hypothetical protein
MLFVDPLAKVISPAEFGKPLAGLAGLGDVYFSHMRLIVVTGNSLSIQRLPQMLPLATAPKHTLRDYLASYVVQRAQQLFEEALNPFVKRCMKDAFPLECVPATFAHRRLRSIVLSLFVKAFTVLSEVATVAMRAFVFLSRTSGFASLISEVHHPPPHERTPKPVIFVPVAGRAIQTTISTSPKFPAWPPRKLLRQRGWQKFATC